MHKTKKAAGTVRTNFVVKQEFAVVMNYFELFDLPVQLKVDKSVVRKRYLELSRLSHPDYFVNKSSEEQGKALESSAVLNKALKTLTNDDEVIGYVLRQKNLLQDDEKYALPPPFLMEMMEFNEAIDDIQGGEQEAATLQDDLDRLEEELYESVKDIVEHYTEGVTTEAALLQVKDYYFKKKYLERLRHQLAQKL